MSDTIDNRQTKMLLIFCPHCGSRVELRQVPGVTWFACTQCSAEWDETCVEQ